MSALAVYAAAAVGEIAGCFAFWAWLRLDRSSLWLVPGLASLAAFAWLLTRIDTHFAGRVYAAYGGVYIAASPAWLWIVEGQRPLSRGARLCTSTTAIGCWARRCVTSPRRCRGSSAAMLWSRRSFKAQRGIFERSLPLNSGCL